MAFSGGVFSRLYNWATDRDAGTKIRADRMDAEMDGMATGLSTCLLKDGTQTVTADIPMGTYKFTGVGDGAARDQYLAVGQLQDGEANWVDGGGTADAITATYTPALTALADGMLLCVRATAANATTTPTFDPGPGSPLTITKNGNAALAAGDIVGDSHELLLRYRHSDTKWELLNPGVANGNFLGGVTAGTAAASKALVLDASADLTSGINDFYVDNDILVAEDIKHTGDTDNLISFGTDTQVYQTGGATRFAISDSGIAIGVGGATVSTINDTDDMSDASATTLATSESIKAYVDASTADILHYQESLANTTAGPSYAAGAWRTVPLNTEQTDTGNHGSVASDQVTLAAGTYEFWGSASVTDVNGSGQPSYRLRLQDITGGTTMAQGVQVNNSFPQSNYGQARMVHVNGYHVLGVQSAVELQIFPEDATEAGLAVGSGNPEIYSDLYLRKIA